jgi:hypothetical protein
MHYSSWQSRIQDGTASLAYAEIGRVGLLNLFSIRAGRGGYAPLPVNAPSNETMPAVQVILLCIAVARLFLAGWTVWGWCRWLPAVHVTPPKLLLKVASPSSAELYPSSTYRLYRQVSVLVKFTLESTAELGELHLVKFL